MRPIKSMEERFWTHVKKTKSCWIWISSKSCGYGHFWRWKTTPKKSNPKKYSPRKQFIETILAHRASWVIHNGEIPKGLWVLHKCDNKMCVNPDHLFLGTRIDNARDLTRKDLQLRGESHPATKLSESDKMKIIRLHESGKLYNSQIADRFKIHSGTVSRIVYIHREVQRQVNAVISQYNHLSAKPPIANASQSLPPP